jgi:hypothetical protein
MVIDGAAIATELMQSKVNAMQTALRMLSRRLVLFLSGYNGDLLCPANSTVGPLRIERSFAVSEPLEFPVKDKVLAILSLNLFSLRKKI